MNLHYIYVPEWIKKMKLNTYTYKICIKNGLRMDGHVKQLVNEKVLVFIWLQTLSNKLSYKN